MAGLKQLKVAIVEIGATHHEVLYPLADLLKMTGAEVKIWVSSSFDKRNPGFDPNNDLSKTVFPDIKKSIWSIFKVRALGKDISEYRPDWVIYNTVAGPVLRSLTSFITKDIRQAGVIHNTKKMQSSSSVKGTCKKLDHLFVLNRELLNWLPNSKEKTSEFYPLEKDMIAKAEMRVKSDGPLDIVIPGQVENARRDYRFLFDTLKGLPSDLNVRFHLLGNAYHEKGDGPDLEKVLDGLNLKYPIILHKGQVPEDKFRESLYSADFIMPLITPSSQGYDNYLKHQITGSYNLAFSLRCPFLTHCSFEHFEDFKQSSVFYNDKNLADVLKQLIENPAIHEKCRTNLLKDKTFSLSYNAEKLRAALT